MVSWREADFAGRRFVLDAGLGLYWPEQEALVVSDLHLEKASFLAQFGSAVAPYDTRDTLARLDTLVGRYRPKRLILLGDTFHDRLAWHRLEDAARAHLLDLCASVEACHWVEGNHDLGAQAGNIRFTEETVLDGVVFRHEAGVRDRPQVIGHFHPKMTTHVRGHRFTGKCFLVGRDLLIMPAFGSFTGGLDITNDVFEALSGGEPFQPYLVYKSLIVPGLMA